MYNYKEINKAVETLIKFNLQYTKTIKTLGYPSARETLRKWYKNYLLNGKSTKVIATRKSKYSEEQIKQVLDYYFEHGENITHTIKFFGYPCRPVLRKWISVHYPEKEKSCTYSYNEIKYSKHEKSNAVAKMISGRNNVGAVAKDIGVTRCTLYNWKNSIVGTDFKVVKNMSENKNKGDLIKEIDLLKKEIEFLKMERDVYEKAAEIIKKDQGINLQTLTNREKTIVIDALKKRYKLKKLLIILHISKSSYFYQTKVLNDDKYLKIRKQIHNIFVESKSTYGYRRIKIQLEKEGVSVSEKVIRRLMKEENIQVIMKKKRKYNSYIGEISPAVKNVINRDFSADKPNTKWLTDITEFHIPSGKVYLSPIVDCFDGMVVSWTVSTSPTAKMVNDMLRSAIVSLKEEETPIIHSDRGGHYRWPEWIKITEERNLCRSMSKKGCSPDNSACEGFFGRLKNEMFYNRNWDKIGIEEFIDELNEYINWYNKIRIKVSLGGLSPLEYRQSLGII